MPDSIGNKVEIYQRNTFFLVLPSAPAVLALTADQPGPLASAILCVAVCFLGYAVFWIRRTPHVTLTPSEIKFTVNDETKQLPLKDMEAWAIKGTGFSRALMLHPTDNPLISVSLMLVAKSDCDQLAQALERVRARKT
jgi:hypothetical protein